MPKKSVPILFIHWLENPSDPREAEPLHEKYRDEVNIWYRYTQSRNEFIHELQDWLTDNDAAQCLFIGAHGDNNGIGDHPDTGIDWPELGDILAAYNHQLSLWLGACHSSHAAAAWSPVKHANVPAQRIVGFPDEVKPSEIQPILKRLVELTSPEQFAFIDEESIEIDKIRETTRVNMHYVAELPDGTREYVADEEFESRVGCSLKEYLTTRGAIPEGGILDEALKTIAESSVISPKAASE